MTQYMLLLYADEKGGEALSPRDMAMWMRKMGEYGDALKKANAFVSTGGLGRVRDARTIHANKDELQVHNGPYAEKQEQCARKAEQRHHERACRRPNCK